MNGFWHDLRFGLRQLVKRPGFSAAAVLTLALGIGVNTAVFSVMNGYLLKPLPYPQGDRLIDVHVSVAIWQLDDIGVSKPLYARIKTRLKAASDSALYNAVDVDFQAKGSAQRLTGVEATGSLFRTLRVKPFLGHVFAPANDQPGRDQVLVLSYRLWQRSFGGDPHVVGRKARLDGQTYRIIGVMPPGFAFPDRAADFWKPLTMTPAEQAKVRFNLGDVFMLARLKPGAQIGTARGQLRAVKADVRHEVPPTDWLPFRFQAVPYHQHMVGAQQASLLLLEGAVLLVLLITCVNVANLLLSRSLGRGHEMAMRAALGATRPRLARQLLIEGLCLAVLGGLAGVGLGWVCLELLKQAILTDQSSIFSVTPDWRVGSFALAVVVVTAILVSLLPIRHLTRIDLQTLLQAGGRSATSGRGAKRTRGALVIVELALATALLAGAGLLLHSFVKLTAVDTGFNTDNVLLAGLLVSPKDHPSDQGLANLYRQVVKNARALPGIEHAGLANYLPFAASFQLSSFKVPGRETPHAPQGRSATVNRINSGYFKALGIPILRGRGFTPRDTMKNRSVAVIDTRAAKMYFKNRNPIGQELKTSSSVRKVTIIGVVQAVTSEHLDKKNPYRSVYMSAFQHPRRTMHLVLKTNVPPESVVRSLEQVVHQTDPAMAVYGIQTMRQRFGDELQGRRTTMAMVLAFGAIALVLAMVGVYGVLSFSVRQRTKECGVRLALGATPQNLLWLIISDGLRLLAIGVAIGLALAIAFGYVASSQLFEVAPFDPLTLIGAVLVLSAVTLIACYLPARRAARLDPTEALQD